VFDFTDADNHFGHLIAGQLSKHIGKLIKKGSAPPLQKVLGQSYLEIKPRELKKSLLVERIMGAITMKQPVDFILYIGDDSSNEEVFSLLKSTKKTMLTEYLDRHAHIFTCTVGKKPTKA
jgi:trehalose-6-phosphatase